MKSYQGIAPTAKDTELSHLTMCGDQQAQTPYVGTTAVYNDTVLHVIGKEQDMAPQKDKLLELLIWLFLIASVIALIGIIKVVINQ